MTEIAEELALPADLGRQWYSRGYYGSLNHNAKAVYQRYLGWYDSHPAHLHPLPPVEAARRYVAAMGGADAVVATAEAAFDAGDYRWVAELLTHVVFSDPGHREAALLQADALEQLGYQSENPTWRNEYLMGALELREGVRDLGRIELATADVFAAMTPELILDYAGISLDATKAADAVATIVWTITDAAAAPGGPVTSLLELRNGVLVHTEGAGASAAGPVAQPVDASVSSGKAALAAALFGARPFGELVEAGEIELSGDRDAVERLFGMMDRFPLWFPIVQP
jgi:alkyl sulfatase BDS1-like metallo-beta-lactamase superfamily hydrolase